MNELARLNTYADPALVAAAEASKARIQSAYIMALQKPRNIDDSRDKILHACRRPMFAEKVEFSKPVGGKNIHGASIRFAELALREWGNVLSDVQVLYEDETTRRTRIMVIDLETNASFSKEIQISKTVERSVAKDREVLGERTNTSGKKVYIVKATDDEIHNKEAALISKALRNEGLRLIPSDIIDEAIEVAHDTLKKRDAADPDAAKKKVLDAFSGIGVKPKDIQGYLKHSTDAMTPAELQELRSIYSAIKDGEAKWIDYINPDTATPQTQQPQPDPQEKAPEGQQAAAPPADPGQDADPKISEGKVRIIKAQLARFKDPDNATVEFCGLFGINKVEDLPQSRLETGLNWITENLKGKK